MGSTVHFIFWKNVQTKWIFKFWPDFQKIPIFYWISRETGQFKSFGKKIFFGLLTYENFIVTEINHYCVTTRCDINFLNAYFLSPRAYILIFGVKYEKKNFFSKKFPVKKISYTPPYEFWRPRKKFFFFHFIPDIKMYALRD